ncbi:MAG: AtpZ/AtpI family protein [Salinivirgaceae bacterium]|nr:AtpZ/AtpI family protein [Salinivirgaceae bacterium]
MIKRKNKDFNKKSSVYYFARYSGMAFEMLGIIILGVFAGQKLDEKRPSEFPLWTLILSLLAIFISLYLVIKGLMKK